jgi:hypothetical protein
VSEPRGSVRAYADFDVRSPFRSYFRVCHYLIVEPEAFFRAVRGGSFWRPTLFVFATYLLVSLLFAPFFLVLLAMMISRSASLPNDAFASLSGPELITLTAPLLAFILAPFGGVLGTFVGALIWHPFVAPSVGIGRGRGFRETYRIAAYQSLPYVLGNFVPVLGIFLAVGGMSYVGVFGVRGAHDASTKRAIIAVVIPLVLTFLLFVAAIATVVVLSNDAFR